MYGSKSLREIGKIRQICYDFLFEYQSNSKIGEKTLESSSSLFDTDYDEQDPLSQYGLFVHSTIRESGVKFELDYYFDEPVLLRISDFDVLDWWKTNEIKYPTLQKIVRDIYVILISTVASESAFSTSGRMVSKHCSKLHSHTLEALMCTQSWLGSEMKSSRFHIFNFMNV